MAAGQREPETTFSPVGWAAETAVIELLTRQGAGEIPHPGGTLLAHLRRVHALLVRWRARPAVRLAGMGHAFYGTDGFPTALGDLARRDELAEVAGEEAERLVYFYASCDRGFSYPGLATDGAGFRDRFTGTVLRPDRRSRQDFAEITVANELDVLHANAGLRARYGGELLELFTSWDELLSDAARLAVRAMLP
ncbi:DUF6817 domain-containing protein [Sphaerisporangium perillae]|uniref:DUF6817 domain-containing protein n=1 Tax=Sphaerisporangium perillae TaxID=2935860 RepID=UPI00200BD666|nr:hypothetical protein [Sphaerisporangium perillae]